MTASFNATPEEINELLYPSPADTVVVAIGAAVFALNFVVLAYVNWHRSYVPLMLKQIPVVNLSLISKTSPSPSPCLACPF